MCSLIGKERHSFFFSRELPPCLPGRSALGKERQQKRIQIAALCRMDVHESGGFTPSSCLLFSPSSSFFFSPRAAFLAFLSASWGEGPCWQTQAKHYYSALQFLSSQPLLLSFSFSFSPSHSFYSSSDTLLLFNPSSCSAPSPPPLLADTSVHLPDVFPGLHQNVVSETAVVS